MMILELVFWLLNLDKCSPISRVCSCPRSVSFLPISFDLQCACLGAVSWLIYSFWSCQIRVWPPLPFSRLTPEFLFPTLLIEGARMNGSLCLCYPQLRQKARGAVKFTILVMIVCTNFPEGLQRLRTDSIPRADLTIDIPHSPLSF